MIKRILGLASCFKGRRWYVAAVLAILVLSVMTRLYWASQKEGMHIDEVASFSVSECDGGYYSPDVQIPTNMDISGKDLKSLFFIHDASADGVVRDLRSMWHNVYDYNHTNFYYSILRIFFLGCDSTDVSTIIMRGVLLNILIYILEFAVFLCLLLVYWRECPLLVLTALTCFAFMVGGISDTLYIRPYELQTLMVLLLALWLTYVVRSMNRGTWRYSVRNFAVTSLLLAGVLWTGYFMVILVCVLGAFLLWETYIHGKFKAGLSYFAGAAIMSLIICYCLYQSYFLGFGGDHRIDNKFSGEIIDVLTRVAKSIAWCGWLTLQKTLYIPVAAILFAIVIYHRKEKWHLPWVTLPAALYTIVVLSVAPYPDNRYIVSATPLILIVIPAILCLLKNRRWLVAATSFITCFYAVWPMFRCNIDNLYEKAPMHKLLENKKNNIYLIQDDHLWLSLIVPYIPDDVTYHLRDTLTTDKDLHSGDVIAWMNTKGGLVASESWTGHTAVSCIETGERPCNKKIAKKTLFKGMSNRYFFSIMK